MKVPVYINLEKHLNYLASNEFNLNKKDPSVFYQLDVNKEFPLDILIDPLTAAPPFDPPFDTTKPYILAPRYFIVIKSPLDQNLPTLKIKIHKSDNSLLKNQARVLLEPSRSYGIKSCYTVDYWEWTPNLNMEADITKKKLASEYWFIPTLDSNYVPYYPYPLYPNNHDINHSNFYNYPRLTSLKIKVIRTINSINNNIVEDLIIDKKYNHIFSFPQDSIISFTEVINTEVFGHNTESKTWDFNKRLAHSLLQRDITKVDGDIINGDTETTVDFIMPFTPDQLIVIE